MYTFRTFLIAYEQRKDPMFFKSLQEKNTIFPFSITYYDHTTTDYEQDFMHAEFINWEFHTFISAPYLRHFPVFPIHHLQMLRKETFLA